MHKLLATTVFLALFAESAIAATPPKLYQVEPQPISQTLYFSGTISPIRTVPVVSPTAGVVDAKYFMYGQMVTKGDKLLHVNTSKISSDVWNAKIDYLNALSDYNKSANWKNSSDVFNAEDSLHKAKRTLQQAQTTFNENKTLYKLGIISLQDLITSQNALEDAKSSYTQAQNSLKQTLSQGEGDALTISELKLKSAEQKYYSLVQQLHGNIIESPATGIILQPDNSSGSSSDANSGSGQQTTNGKVDVSSTITYQQVLFNIGDLGGIKVSFSVPEININQIAKGQTAVITGAGFPGISLNGLVTDVGAQASSSSGGSIPSFPVVVQVAKITDAQRKEIRSGMDAQVALTVYSQQQALMVPVDAVSQNSQGQSIVQLYDPSSKTSKPLVIQTGTVGSNTVEVTSGLTAGQQVVLPN
jgi:multidrug efflux pump subunit AcrA (membrane-fusion protein)